MSDRPIPPPETFAPSPHLTVGEAAAKAGMDSRLATRVWRALGMPEPGEEDVLFDDRDVETLTVLRGVMDLGIPAEDMLTMTRLYGTTLARIADAETRLFRDRVLTAVGADSSGVEERLRPAVESLLDGTARLLDQAHRRHLVLALNSLRGAGTQQGSALAAGFVDLVDFSRISEDLPGEELGGMIEAFEDLAVEACAERGARLVKVIGDAVMFVSTDPAPALHAAMTVVRRARESNVLPTARAGLDFGEAVALGGDYFGRPVNVAARITAFARPDSVVASKEFLEAVGRDGVDGRRIGSRNLKGVGRLLLYKIREPEPQEG
jgi:adenylate cyclase